MRADKGNAGDGLWGVRKGERCRAPFSSNPALLCLVKDYRRPNHCCTESPLLCASSHSLGCSPSPPAPKQ